MKNERKKGNKQAIIVITIITLVITGILLLTLPIFLVKNIKVIGNKKITNEEIIKKSRMLTSKNIFLENYLKGEYQLRNDKRISSAKIQMKLPDTVEILIEEREEQYQFATTSGYVVIDKDGYILKKTDNKNNLPIIKGLKKENYTEEDKRIETNDLYTLDTINKLYRNLKSLDMLTMVNEIEITPKEYILKLEEEKKSIFIEISTTDQRAQLLKINEVINQTKGKEGQILIDKNEKREYIIFKEKV